MAAAVAAAAVPVVSAAVVAAVAVGHRRYTQNTDLHYLLRGSDIKFEFREYGADDDIKHVNCVAIRHRIICV